MDVIIAGLSDALSFYNLLFIFFGVSLGIVVGAIPGLSAPMAIAIAVPITFYMDSLVAIAFLMGVNKGGEFGGSISAILLNTPGTPESAATALDGYPLAQKGKQGKALKMALYSSVSGDTFSDIVLIVVSAPLATVALKMGPAEVLGFLVFALTFITALVGKSLPKGLAAAAFGIFVSTVGLDPETAEPRFTFGFLELENGIPLPALGIGLLAFAEVIRQMEMLSREGVEKTILLSLKGGNKDDQRVTREDFRECRKTILRSACIGTVVGAIPGLGYSLAGFLGYGAARKASKNPEEFGKGRLEGVAATEAANSAVVGSNLIPLLALGIPGNATAGLLIGAFIIHGVIPGPLMFKENGALVYGLFGSLILANMMNLCLGSIGLRLFVQSLRVPRTIMLPIVVLLCFTGAYAAGSGLFSTGLMLLFGVIGYLMQRLQFSIISLFVAYIIGPMFEKSLRHTVILIDDPRLLLDHPVLLVMVILSIISAWRMSRRPTLGS